MANVEVAVANTALQNADEDRPDGSVRFEESGAEIPTHTYDGNGNITGTRYIRRWKKTTTLTDRGQTQFDGQQDIAIAMNEWALAQTGVLRSQQSTPLSVGDLTVRQDVPTAATIDTTVPTLESLILSIGEGDVVAHHATVRDAIDDRLQYQIALDRANRIIQLAHKGLVPGMKAYDDDLLAFSRESTDARIQAYLAAGQELTRMLQTEGLVGTYRNDAVHLKFRLEAALGDLRNGRRMMAYQALSDAAGFVNTQRAMELQERIAVRGQNVNEISTLMHGGAVQVPSFQQFRAGPIDRTPVADSVYQSAAMDMQKWQMKVQQQQAMMGGILGSGVSFPLGVDSRGGVALAHDEQDVHQAIQIILGTAPGERPMRPEFGCGIHDFVFESVDADMLGRLEAAIRDALDHWEPRIQVVEVAFDLQTPGLGPNAAEVLLIDIAYRLRETNALRNLVYPFYVVPAEEE